MVPPPTGSRPGAPASGFLRNQIAVVVATLACLFILAPLIVIIPFVKEVDRYLTGAAATGDHVRKQEGRPALLRPWQGALLLLARGVLFAGLGWVLFVRRDVLQPTWRRGLLALPDLLTHKGLEPKHRRSLLISVDAGRCPSKSQVS